MPPARVIAVPRDLVESVGEGKIRKALAKWAEGLRELREDPKRRRGSVTITTDWDGEAVDHCGVGVSRKEHV